jgi:hypothetical protein
MKNLCTCTVLCEGQQREDIVAFIELEIFCPFEAKVREIDEVYTATAILAPQGAEVACSICDTLASSKKNKSRSKYDDDISLLV